MDRHWVQFLHKIHACVLIWFGLPSVLCSCLFFSVLWLYMHRGMNGQLSHVRFFVTPWTAASQAFLSITNSQSLLKLMSIKSVMPSNCLVFWHPLLLPSIFPCISVFSMESVLCDCICCEWQLLRQFFVTYKRGKNVTQLPTQECIINTFFTE